MVELNRFLHTALPTKFYQLKRPDTPAAPAKAALRQYPENLFQILRGVWTLLGRASEARTHWEDGLEAYLPLYSTPLHAYASHIINI